MLIGLAFYAGFTIVTKIYIGYVSLAVGWLVAKAIMMGSKGVGGKRYQIAAVILTYAAVSMAAIPIAIALRSEESKSSPAVQSDQSLSPDARATPNADSGARAKPKVSFGAVLLIWIAIGLASPFLALQDPFHGVIGLVILFVGIRIAWRLTQGSAAANIEGPYDNTASASVMR